MFLLMLKSGKRERLKWREKMRDVNVGERERRGVRMKDFEKKKKSKKGERERETYEWIQSMRKKKKKVKKNNYL
jgi:hypothetical protein